MAGIKLGKPIVLLMKKDTPSKFVLETKLANDSFESAIGGVTKDGI